jgi:hypothetical protein
VEWCFKNLGESDKDKNTNADHFPILAIYGGLTAGIFEELGRFVAFFFLLKKYLEYKDGFFSKKKKATKRPNSSKIPAVNPP